MTFYKLAGLTIGIILIALAIIWGPDPDACSYLLLVGGLMVLLGSTEQEIVNKEENKGGNRPFGI